MGSVRSVLGAVYAQMSARRRKQFYLLLALMLAGGFAELVSIGAVLPFLSLLAGPERLERFPWLIEAFHAVGADTLPERFIALGILFSLTILVASGLRLLLAWVTHAFAFRLGHEIGVELHRRLLYQSYSWHVQRNSSEAVAAHDKVQVLTFSVFLPIMVGISSLSIAAFIVAILVYIDPFTALITAISFSVIYAIISLFTRRRLFANSNIINAAYAQRIQAVQESLGGIRDVILDRSQPLYLAEFQAIDRRLRHAQAINLFIGAAPRYMIEGAGMIVIILVAILLSGGSGGIAGALPILGALALGAQRLLPLLQHVYYGWVQVRGNWPIAVDVVNLISLPMPPRELLEGPPPAPLPFEREIRFDGVGFRYPAGSAPVLSGIDLTIEKGQRLALIGTTGSGKSTLVDLLMGLLEPQEGTILVDGVPLSGEARRRWSAQIAHVPQSIYLADTTIARNIAFGCSAEEVDPARVREAARQAQLDTYIEALPEGYETRVGERGVRLSGGQRQRLGLARALYKRSPVLILDEATSALDEKTEAAVMGALEGLDEALTIVMIAHRLSTIANCDVVVRLDGGRLVDIGPYEQIVGRGGAEAIQRRGSE